MEYHGIAFALGFVLDLMLGDPHGLPHPVRLIGALIALLEKKLLGVPARGTRRGQFRRGVWMAALVAAAATGTAALLLGGAYLLHPAAGVAAEAVMTYYLLAARSLKEESMAVYCRLREGDLPGARTAVSMIVGRDTQCLDSQGVIKAAVETVAENTSDGVIAPMLYTAFGGPVLGFLYKAVNTMDSMVGYQNERYLYFGRAAARLDDGLNYLPARVSAWLMIGAAFLGGKDFSGPGAYRIWKRDKRNHKSPNSAQTEAVCAGALGIRLAGDASYAGRRVEKPFIGDALRPPEASDIPRANRLMLFTAWMGELLCLASLALLAVL